MFRFESGGAHAVDYLDYHWGIAMRMHNPPHPGEILSGLWLEPLGLTVGEAAARLNVPGKAVAALLDGKAAVTPEMALRLEMAFGKSAESWLAHQAAFDLWQLESRRAALGVKLHAAPDPCALRESADHAETV